jgi:GAF domain-containing protein
VRARLAWTLFALTCVSVAVQVTTLVLSNDPVISRTHLGDAFPLVTLACVVGAGIGALVVSRYPAHRIGWLLVAGMFGTALGLAAQGYGRAALEGDLGSAPGAHLAVWVSRLFDATFAVAMLAALFLLAPNGRLLSRRWRWAMGALLAGVILHLLRAVVTRPSELDADGAVTSGKAPLVDLLTVPAVLVLFTTVVAGGVSLLLRLRRSAGVERQQLRWVAAAAGGLALGVAVAVVAGLLGVPNWLSVLPLMLAYLCVPLFTGVAILRFHLYEIDVIISRAIVLAVLSGLVAVGYVAVVVLLGQVVDDPAEGTFWPSLMLTALVAIGVQPLRRRVVQLADRVVYGARAAPYEALADFSDGLQESPTPEDLLPRVAESVGRAVGARHVQISVSLPGVEAASAAWPADRPPWLLPDLVVPVADREDVLGVVEVTMPPGRSVRAHEERLLHDFAAQLGRALRNLRLESELAEWVQELAAQADELAASSRRLLSAQAAGRQRFEAALDREVLPHLVALPRDLVAAAQASRLGPHTVNRMVARTNDALEALRTLTRGVFPAQLTHRGLVPTLSSQLGQAGLAGILRVDDTVATARFDTGVETALYFCAVEFLRELDPPELVQLAARDGTLVLEASGRGTPGLGARTGHLADRVAPLGGTVLITGAEHATLRVEVPFGSDLGLVPEPGQGLGVEG